MEFLLPNFGDSRFLLRGSCHFGDRARVTGHSEARTFIEFPPMQRGASFNLDAIKRKMGKRMAEA